MQAAGMMQASHDEVQHEGQGVLDVGCRRYAVLPKPHLHLPIGTNPVGTHA